MDKGYKVSILSIEPEIAVLIFTLFPMKDKMIEDDAMVLCNYMHVGEFIKFFGLEVYADLEKFSLDRVWSGSYMTERAELMFDIRPSYAIVYRDEFKRNYQQFDQIATSI